MIDMNQLTAPPCGASVWSTNSLIMGKPVWLCTTAPFNAKSGFQHKLLCDGYTFSAGTSCAYSCRYCYVESQVLKQKPVRQVLERSQRRFDEVVLRRREPLRQLARQLTRRATSADQDNRCERLQSAALVEQLGLQGRAAKYMGAEYKGKVIYASPLADVAATKELAAETVELCELMLRLTAFDIRLLSKSPLLASHVAQPLAERMPESKTRVIYGLSTGTVGDGTVAGNKYADRVARAIEPDAPSPTRRLQAIHWLQDNGFRVYGVVCPILPQADPVEYARQVVQAIRADRCEHVWAEPFNARVQKSANSEEAASARPRDSFAATLDGLLEAGFAEEAQRFQRQTGDPGQWEHYARATFEAFAEAVPPLNGGPRLRWLQYPGDYEVITSYWAGKQAQGAVLLGGMVTKARQKGIV